jgi:hypothetical protein
MAREITITDQFDRDGNIIDQIAKWTEQIPEKKAISKTTAQNKEQELLNKIAALEAELLDIQEVLLEFDK